MNGIEINKYIIRNAMTVATLKNMELYKLNLPNGIINSIIDYSMDEEDVCESCINWRDNQTLIKCVLGVRIHNRNVEDEVLIFLTVNKLQPYEYVKTRKKI